MTREHAREIPTLVRQFLKPRDGDGYTWKPLYEDPMKPQRRTAWQRVSKGVPPAETEIKVSAQHFDFKLPDLPVSDEDD